MEHELDALSVTGFSAPRKGLIFSRLANDSESGARRASEALRASTQDHPVSQRPQPAEPERIIDARYRVVRMLGEGGFGQVFECEHVGMPRSYAVKLLLPEIARRKGVLERFLREAQAAGGNDNGELGDATIDDKTAATPVSGLAQAVALEAGSVFSCAIIADKTARCWGGNGSGQLGDSTTNNSTTPVTVKSFP